MPVEITDLSNIDLDKLAESETFIVQALLEQFPYLDLNQKVLRQVLVRPEAMLRTLGKENTDRVRASFSLPEMMADPAAADDDTIENILGNVMLTRRQGTKSSGQIVIVVSVNVTTPLSGNVIFTSNGQAFKVTQPYIGVTEAANIVSARDRLMTERDDGTYGFVVDVEAMVMGGAGKIKQGATFDAAPPIANMVKAYAETDFNEGTDTESNQQLLARYAEGIAARSTADRVSIEAIIRDSFSQVGDVSIIGAGDPEMLRDGHNLMGIKTGGRVDVYVRSTTLPSLLKLTETATLVDADAQTWQISLDKDAAPGFYRIEKIVKKDADILGGYEIVEDARGVDITSPDFEYVPLISDAAEGVYSAYQTAVIKFTDPDTPIATLVEGEATQEYDLYVRVMPNIRPIQDFVGSRTRQSPNADYLVRAPMPCFVSIGIKVQYQSGTTIPSAVAIQQEIARVVNATTFSVPRLSASIIIDRVHNLLGDFAFVDLPIDMRGTIRTQEGDEVYLRDTDALEITTQAAISVPKAAIQDDAEKLHNKLQVVIFLKIGGVERKVFEGYTAGAPYQRTYNTAAFSVGVVGWLDDLRNSSAMSSAFAVGTPSDFFASASSSITGAALFAASAAGEEITGAAADVWGAIDSALTILCTKGLYTALGDTAATEGGMVRPIGFDQNTSAVNALARFSGNVLPLALTSGRLPDSVDQHIGDFLFGLEGSDTVWGKIMGLADLYGFSIIPLVDDAKAAAYVPFLQSGMITKEIKANEYAGFSRAAYSRDEIRGAILMGAGASITNVIDGVNKGQMKTTAHYVLEEEGQIFIGAAPRWLSADVSAETWTPRTTGASGKGVRATGVAGGGGDPTENEDFNDHKAAETVGKKYARHVYLANVLAQRNARLTGMVRFDIGPGTPVKIETGGTDVYGSKYLYGGVKAVTISAETRSPRVSTDFEIENYHVQDEDDTAATGHPLFGAPYLGDPLVP